MISNILLGIGILLFGSTLGFVAGNICAMRMVTKVNEIYKKDTGNDFISWVFDKSNEVRKHRIEIYAAE